jgi:hypothetical protein
MQEEAFAAAAAARAVPKEQLRAFHNRLQVTAASKAL